MATFGDFLQALGNKESSGNYGAINQLNYLGKYQMGEAALIDAGYYTADGTKKNDWSGTWIGKDGVNSWQDFVNSPQAQENAILDYIDKQWGYIKNYGMDKYIGQTINGVLITESGLIAAAHLGGIGNLINYLKSDGKNDFKDGNKTPISSYMKDFAGYELMMNERICPAEPLPWYYTVNDVFKGLFDFLGSISDSLSRYFTRATQWRPSADPLTLDLDGDGIETVGIKRSNQLSAIS